MAAGLAAEFESRFTEALDTPPMQEPLRSLLGPKGDSPFAQVLAGTAPLQNMDIDVGRFWLQIQSYELETRNIENGNAKIRSKCETMVKMMMSDRA